MTLIFSMFAACSYEDRVKQAVDKQEACTYSQVCTGAAADQALCLQSCDCFSYMRMRKIGRVHGVIKSSLDQKVE